MFNLADVVMNAAASLKGNTFIGMDYTNSKGEEGSRVVQIGVDTEKMYRADLAKVEAIIATETDPVRLQAATELRDSLQNSLTKGIGNNDAYTKAGHYTPVVPGVKLGPDGTLYIQGVSRHKTVTKPGTYKPVKSSEKTLAKNAIRRELTSGKIREFKVNSVSELRMMGETFTVVDAGDDDE